MDQWSEEEEKIIRGMRAGHKTITEMARKIGRSYFAVQSFLQRERKRKDYWTSLEVRTLNQALAKGLTPAQIQELLPARTINAITGKITYIQEKKARPILPRVVVPDRLWDERDMRAQQRSEMSEAQLRMGDPPFCQSALGRRHATVA